LRTACADDDLLFRGSPVKTIIFTLAAAKDLDQLQPQDRDRVTAALTQYAMYGTGDVKRLSGRTEFRLRIGEFRVIFAEDQITILAIYIGRRQTTTYRRR
jgi:mRNA interferase RelE/StbE